MKKSLWACALCAVLLLTSAAPVRALRSPGNFYDDSVARSQTGVVYCLSEDRYRLVPQVRQLTILGGETALEVLAAEVLKESKKSGLISAASERVQIYLLSVFHTGRIVTVDLGGDADSLEPYELFCLKAAMVNTMVESGQADYVNVLFNGREVSTNNDLPTGTMTRFEEDLQSAWAEHENEGLAALRSPDYPFKRNVTLYFPSNTSNFLLAEVRQITFTRSNLVAPVVSALIGGPMTSTVLRRSYPTGADIDGLPMKEEESANIAYWDINFSYQMGNALTGNRDQRRLALAPLVLTLTTFLPETDAVSIRVNRRPIESLAASEGGQRLLYRSQFTGLIGRTMELYFPKPDGRLLSVTRAVAQKDSSLRNLLEQLLLVPDEVMPVFPEGFGAEHILGVALMDDTAVVNFSQSGADLLRGLGERESASLFSIVNTLTGYPGVSRVQFLVEGNKVDALAGVISVRSPLLRNPGIIQTTLN